MELKFDNALDISELIRAIEQRIDFNRKLGDCGESSIKSDLKLYQQIKDSIYGWMCNNTIIK